MKNYLEKDDIKYLIGRLERAINFVDYGNNHMACTSLLADISLLKGTIKEPSINLYRCNKCGRSYERDSEKAWMNSYCDITDQPARLYKVK